MIEILRPQPQVAPAPVMPRVSIGVNSRSLGTAGFLVLALCAAMWTAVVGALAVRRHSEFLSHRFDLGNMTQAVWSTAQGRPLEVTDGQTGDQIVRLAAHVDPVLVLFVPFWWIHPGPETLIVVQAAALAAGLYPVVRLALKHVGSALAAVLLGGWYLAFPWLVWNAFNDVHPVTLAIPLLLYAIWFLDEHHLGRFALFGVLALLTGELVGLTVAALGVWYAIRHRRRRAGLTIAIGGVSWTAICMAFVIPTFNDGRPSRFYGLFEGVGGSPRGLLATLFTDPGAVLAQVATAADGSYVVWLLLPTALLALGQPVLLATVAPQLGVNVLSELWSSTQPMFQYVAPIVAPLVAASIMTLGRLPERVRLVAAALPLCAALVCLAWTPPVPGEQEYVFASTESETRTAAMSEAIDLVPAEAAVTVTNRLGAHLSARRAVYAFPERSGSKWAVIDTRDAWLVDGFRIDEPMFRNLLSRYEHDSAWRLVFERADIRVYRRAS